ncbi:MAG: hypothetical protein ACFFD4_16130 [Candidatus Odinarchaeota archaeon]
MTESETTEIKCPHCDSVYNDQESFDKHMKYAHTLYRSKGQKRKELTPKEKTIKFLKKHPVIWALFAFAVWFGLSFVLSEVLPVMRNGVVQMIILAILGMGLGLALMYEFLGQG